MSFDNVDGIEAIKFQKTYIFMLYASWFLTIEHLLALIFMFDHFT